MPARSRRKSSDDQKSVMMKGGAANDKLATKKLHGRLIAQMFVETMKATLFHQNVDDNCQKQYVISDGNKLCAGLFKENIHDDIIYDDTNPSPAHEFSKYVRISPRALPGYSLLLTLNASLEESSSTAPTKPQRMAVKWKPLKEKRGLGTFNRNWTQNQVSIEDEKKGGGKQVVIVCTEENPRYRQSNSNASDNLNNRRSNPEKRFLQLEQDISENVIDAFFSNDDDALINDSYTSIVKSVCLNTGAFRKNLIDAVKLGEDASDETYQNTLNAVLRDAEVTEKIK